jgi:hypothetical protein
VAVADSDMLAAIQTAIFTIVSGTAYSYTINGRNFTSLDLDKLQKMEAFYSGRVARAAGRRTFAAGVFGEPS